MSRQNILAFTACGVLWALSHPRWNLFPTNLHFRLGFGIPLSNRLVTSSYAFVIMLHLIRMLARPEGFEPPTNRVEAGCSNPLSYGRNYQIILQRRFSVERLLFATELPKTYHTSAICSFFGSLMPANTEDYLGDDYHPMPMPQCGLLHTLMGNFHIFF